MAIKGMKFETETCSRCGGTGRYSFNGKHSRCYKCNGKGIQESANGTRAREAKESLINERLHKPVEEFNTGESVFLSRDINSMFADAGYYRIAESRDAGTKWELVIEGKANCVVRLPKGFSLRMHNIPEMLNIYREVAAKYKGATLIEG